jgi:formate hydrogenlyase transcriptional activator
MDYARRMRKPIRAIAEQFMEALAHHPWPGNVRELQNFIERSVILSTGPVLTGSLPDLTCAQKASEPVTLEAAASSHILQTLLQTGWVVGGANGAAARLGLRRTTLISKMRRLGLKRGQSSALPEPAVESVTSSEEPILRIPPLSAIAREGASSVHSNPHSDVERVYAAAEA